MDQVQPVCICGQERLRSSRQDDVSFPGLSSYLVQKLPTRDQFEWTQAYVRWLVGVETPSETDGLEALPKYVGCLLDRDGVAEKSRSAQDARRLFRRRGGATI